MAFKSDAREGARREWLLDADVAHACRRGVHLGHADGQRAVDELGGDAVHVRVTGQVERADGARGIALWKVGMEWQGNETYESRTLAHTY